MSDRGLPTPDGAPACPFVAFDDDRDARSTAPDHRHRCFAEQTPAPRALAHQDAYCLSPAFPVCPAFQDWARREAAPARNDPGSAPARSVPVVTPPPLRPSGQGPLLPPPPPPAPPIANVAPVAPVAPAPPRSGGPTTGDPDPAPVTDGPGLAAWTGRPGERGPVPDGRRYPPVTPVEPGRRAVPRDWAAPPPWAADESPLPAGAADDTGADSPPSTAIPGWGSRPGTPVHRTGSSRPSAPESRVDRSRGLAGSEVERLAGPDPAGPPARPAGAYQPDDIRPVVAGQPQTPRREPAARPALDPAGRHAAEWQGREPQDAGEPHEARTAADLFGPAWEQPRRFEAYPTLRTRVGLPSFAGVPPVAVGAVALVIAAALLFFIGPMLLGIGGKGPGAASPSPVATAVITPSPLPTEPPVPTPMVYTVVKGDTATRIAAKFGITVDQLMAANPQIKNPDKIKIGDQLTIPVPVATEVSGVEGASAQP